MIIDAHTHVGPDLEHGVKAASYPSARPPDLIAAMDANGIERAIVFGTHWQTRGRHVDPNYEQGNRYVRDAVRKYPDRLIGFARANPNFGRQAVDELDRALREDGMRGIKLHPDLESFYMASDHLVDPIFALAAERRVPLLIYSGYPLRAQPLRFLRYAERFPAVPIILAHMGFRMVADAITVAERAPNIYLETSCQSSVGILRAVQRLGPRRVLFGSDFPYEVPRVELARIGEYPGFDAGARERIFGGNAAELLGLN